MIIDKRCVQQVLGSLVKRPQYLSEVDKYSFILTDFPSRFEKYIYTAINGLYKNGAPKIQIIDIENYLNADPSAKDSFKQNNGIEYLQDIVELSEAENFDYYYNRFKKLNLLKDLEKGGFDISEFYESNLAAANAQEVNEAFENLTIRDIVDSLRGKLVGFESKYTEKESNEIRTAFDGLEDVFENSSAGMDIGMPIQGHIFNMIIGGARLGTLTVRSSASGVGKTRTAVADACRLAYPVCYNQVRGEWEQIGSSEKVMLIITEQSFAEIQRMILAYLTGLNESKLRYGNLSEQENILFKQAIQIVKNYEENLIILRTPEPTVSGIKASVRENCILHNISYVFMDYIFVNPSLLREFQGFNIRNDEALLFLTTALKDLSGELDLCIFTSTQVNAKADSDKDIRNESVIAGSRAIVNKCDNGAVLSRPSKEDLEIISDITKSYQEPNMVTDIYKNRSGEYTNVRVWSYFDLGALRKQDLFVTNSKLEVIEDFYEQPDIQVVNFEDEEGNEVRNFIRGLNKND